MELILLPEWIHLHNVYNPSPSLNSPHGTIPLLTEILEKSKADEHIVVGDFNLHHPYWTGASFDYQHCEVEVLLETLQENKLRLLLLPGMPTWETLGRPTTIDLIFATR